MIIVFVYIQTYTTDNRTRRTYEHGEHSFSTINATIIIIRIWMCLKSLKYFLFTYQKTLIYAYKCFLKIYACLTKT